MAAEKKLTQSGVVKWLCVLLWVAILIVAGLEFHGHRNYQVQVVLGPGVTGVRKLSDYHPGLKGSVNDCNLYILDSGVPGATFFVAGGTHPEEPAGTLSALHLVENARVSQGRLIVVVFANRSASLVTRPSEAYPLFYSIPTAWGERRFRMGDRFASPLDSWPDPEVYQHFPSRQSLAYMDIRNLNRTWPGRPNGLISEQTCYAMIAMMKAENVDFFIDLHEAELEYPIISTIVAHQTAAPVGAMTSMMLSEELFHLGIEYSPIKLRGLSHREVGDAGIPAVVLETPEPFLDRVRGVTGEKLLLTGQDDFVKTAGKYKLLYEAIGDDGWPIALRVGRHNSTILKMAEIWTFMINPEKPLFIEGVPTYEEVRQNGVGHYLLDPSAAADGRVVYE